MALVLVQHDISHQIVEIDEIHLAHPVLGPHYKRVRVNANGKVYAWNAKDPDEDSETEVKAVMRDGVIVDSDAAAESTTDAPDEPTPDAPQEPTHLSPAEPIETTPTTKSAKAKVDH